MWRSHKWGKHIWLFSYSGEYSKQVLSKGYLMQWPVPSQGWYQILRVRVCALIGFFTAINFGSLYLSFFLEPTSSSLANSPIRAPCCSWVQGRICLYYIAWSDVGNLWGSNIYLPVILYNITASLRAAVSPFFLNNRQVAIYSPSNFLSILLALDNHLLPFMPCPEVSLLVTWCSCSHWMSLLHLVLHLSVSGNLRCGALKSIK